MGVVPEKVANRDLVANQPAPWNSAPDSSESSGGYIGNPSGEIEDDFGFDYCRFVKSSLRRVASVSSRSIDRGTGFYWGRCRLFSMELEKQGHRREESKRVPVLCPQP